MSTNVYEHFLKTLEIMMSEEKSLLLIARMTGLDIVSFYNFADLKGIDISNQDLRGLNFRGADMRQCKLDGVKYDAGAFNGAYLESGNFIFQDEFDVNIENIILIYEKIKYIYLYGRFRKGFLDEAIYDSGYKFGTFAHAAGINYNTLIRARRGEVIRFQTAHAISIVLMNGFIENDTKFRHNKIVNQEVSYYRQPTFIFSQHNGTSIDDICLNSLLTILPIY